MWYIWLHNQFIRVYIYLIKFKGKILLKSYLPWGDLLRIFAKGKWIVELYPKAMMKIAIECVGSFIPLMANCPSEKYYSHNFSQQCCHLILQSDQQSHKDSQKVLIF